MNYKSWVSKVDEHLVSRCGMTHTDLPESGPMPFDYPDFRVEHEVGTSPTDVAEQVLWCAGFPGAVPVL